MKRILIVLTVLFCGLLKAQNPDGRNASLHITPSWLLGNADYERITPTIIPQGIGYINANIRDAGVVKYPAAFSLDLMLKVPMASFLSVSFSYSFLQRFEEINTPISSVDNTFYYWSLKGSHHRISVTASIYNVFSVY